MKNLGLSNFWNWNTKGGDQIIQPFCRIGSPQGIRSPLFTLKVLQETEKSTAESIRTYWNLRNDQEFCSWKFLKSKYRRRDQIVQPLFRIGSPQEIRPPFFTLRVFQANEKSPTESIRSYWNLMNDKEFGSFKFLKLKYRRRDQIIQPFFRIGSPQEIRSPLYFQGISRNREKYYWIN